MTTSLRGHCLVASPSLKDPNFYRSVVLMVQHDESGALGLILNRPTGSSIRDIWEMVSSEPCACDSPIYLGGPVRGPLAAVHQDRDRSDLEVVDGLYYTVDEKSLGELLQSSADTYRIFVGYAGWAPGQLESELEAGGWLTTPANRQEVFSEPARLWQTISRRIGREFLQATVKLKGGPEDPSLN
ncbi:MAG: YqgE/AlgH family protein [Pirellulaceae bacterium]